MTIWLLACLLCSTGVPARAPLRGTDRNVRAGVHSIGVPPTNKGLTRFYKGTTAVYDVDGWAHFCALTPSPSPTAWERGAERGHGAAHLLSRAAGEEGGVEGRMATAEPLIGKRLQWKNASFWCDGKNAVASSAAIRSATVGMQSPEFRHFGEKTQSVALWIQRSAQDVAQTTRSDKRQATAGMPSHHARFARFGDDSAFEELAYPTGFGLDRNVQATNDAPSLERDAQATGSLWSEKSGSLFEDFKARRVGDLVTIVVAESTTASARANTAVQKSESASTTAGVGPLLNFLWPELGASGRTDSNVQGNTARAGTLQTRITVQVVETFPNGVLRIEGRRTLKINEETQTLVFSGLVRIRDIRSDNTVPSTAIANAEIYFEGKGIVGSRQREGILTRLFKIVF